MVCISSHQREYNLKISMAMVIHCMGAFSTCMSDRKLNYVTDISGTDPVGVCLDDQVVILLLL